jgi:hypothetical protein
MHYKMCLKLYELHPMGCIYLYQFFSPQICEVGWLFTKLWMLICQGGFYFRVGGSNWLHKKICFFRCRYHNLYMFITCWRQILKYCLFKCKLFFQCLSLTNYWILNNVALWQQMFQHGRFCAYWMWKVVDLCLFYFISIHKKKHLNHYTKLTSLVFVFCLKTYICAIKLHQLKFFLWKV